jgi:hypothetical protein
MGLLGNRHSRHPFGCALFVSGKISQGAVCRSYGFGPFGAQSFLYQIRIDDV